MLSTWYSHTGHFFESLAFSTRSFCPFSNVKRDNVDFVFGSRYMKDGYSEDDTIITLIGNKIFSFLGNLLFSLRISDILYTFVMGDTKKTKELNLKENDFAFCVFGAKTAKRFPLNI